MEPRLGRTGDGALSSSLLPLLRFLMVAVASCWGSNYRLCLAWDVYIYYLHLYIYIFMFWKTVDSLAHLSHCYSYYTAIFHHRGSFHPRNAYYQPRI